MTLNPKIRELALQANPASKEIYESDNWEYNCAAWCAQDLEKFAELIVRECVDIACQYDEPTMSGPGMIIAGRIETHFGVEE